MEHCDLTERIKFFTEKAIARRELSGLDAKIFSEGFAEGFKEGFEEGRKEVREKAILPMLSNDLSFQVIAKCSGYPEKKIKELKVRFIEEGLLPALRNK